jgi:hypothetical protein
MVSKSMKPPGTFNRPMGSLSLLALIEALHGVASELHAKFHERLRVSGDCLTSDRRAEHNRCKRRLEKAYELTKAAEANYQLLARHFGNYQTTLKFFNKHPVTPTSEIKSQAKPQEHTI